jgi:hypothetical protein
MRRVCATILIALTGVTGCGEKPAPQPAVVVKAPPVPPAAPVVRPAAKIETPAKPKAPLAFPFPKDEGGKAVAKVVAPQAPPPLPVERFDLAPKPRTPAASIVHPDPTLRPAYAPPPLLPAPTSGTVPTAPAERVPSDLGFGATAVPARPVLPNPPGITERAPDVNVPPKLAPLGRRVPDRASFDDPTSAAANAAIVRNSPTPSLIQSGFLRVGIPDPFELGEQVKPRIEPAAEPQVLPVPVNPHRPK